MLSELLQLLLLRCHQPLRQLPEGARAQRHHLLLQQLQRAKLRRQPMQLQARARGHTGKAHSMMKRLCWLMSLSGATHQQVIVLPTLCHAAACRQLASSGCMLPLCCSPVDFQTESRLASKHMHAAPSAWLAWRWSKSCHLCQQVQGPVQGTALGAVVRRKPKLCWL